jgi:hypothetical protein
MALTIPHSFTAATIAEASEVNSNFSAVKLFVDALEDGTGIASSAITEAKIATSAISESKIAGLAITEGKIADNAVTQVKIADRAVGSAELDNLTLNPVITTSYTLALTDAHKLITLNNPSSITVTVPLEASVNFQVGDQVNLLQIGLGQVTVAGATVAVNVRSQGGKLKLNGQYAAGTLVKIAADEWVFIGNTAV